MPATAAKKKAKRPVPSKNGKPITPARILAIDIGGTKVKCLLNGENEPRKVRSGKRLTPGKTHEATSYYAPLGGAGLALRAAPHLFGPRARIGIVGLGAGTLACYRQPGEQWRFYEIDPAIAQIAQDRRAFTFLADCAPDAPIAIGEVFNSVYDVTTLVTEELIDYLRMPLCHGGGITHLAKVAALASAYHVQTGFHGATDLSPVNLAASLHFDLAINNFGIQEYMPHPDVTHEVFKPNYRYEEGHLAIDDTPGIGVDLDEAAAAKFPYRPASLPVARKTDGTAFHW